MADRDDKFDPGTEISLVGVATEAGEISRVHVVEPRRLPHDPGRTWRRGKEFVVELGSAAAFAQEYGPDLDQGRLFIHSVESPDLNALACVRFVVPLETEPAIEIALMGRVVVRRTGGGRLPAGFGVELSTIPSGEHAKIERVLDALPPVVGTLVSAEPAASPSDRRGAPRAPFTKTVTLWMGSHRAAARAVDLSSGGIGLTVAAPLDAGTQVGVQVELHDGGTPMELAATVLWSSAGAEVSQTGLRFRELSEGDALRISRCVERIRSRRNS